ncbi:hypothetical protein [Streptomyces sp. NPDC046197]
MDRADRPPRPIARPSAPLWSGSATHTVKIVVVGTSGRPAITTDGLVYLR